MSNKNKILGILLVVVVFGLAVGVGGAISCDRLFPLGEGPEVIDQAWSEILANYVDRDNLDTAALTQGAIEGMIESLDDPYSFFMTAEEYEVSASSFEGEFEGIGAYVSLGEDGLVLVTSLIADSPAEKAGILGGDKIVEIDGEPVVEMTFTEALLKIRGPEGTSLDLLIIREEVDEPFIVTVIRARVEVDSVMLEMKDDYAYIIITSFTERTGEEMAEILGSIDQDTTAGIVLDLRGNPGGTVSTVILVASHFIENGKILDIRDNQGEITTYEREEVTPYITLPLVVLVDEFSASGSEVLAGALQDHDRAVIAGATTYGKGSVNEIIRFNDGSAIFLTIARWLTPDSHLIEGQGITPDIELDITGDDAVQWAIEYLESNN
jgi:carboxyl-terminal processing protease